ncbi:MAG: nitroreductase, partial [Coriobacteriia bacterium]|nr:nitroreductase [Coriobacteriia bacterium]
LYKAIFERKSIRRYSDRPVSDQMMQDICDFTSSTALRLFPQIAFSIEVVSPSEVGKLGVPKAPHFLLFYTKAGDDGNQHLLNAGFVLQQVDLYLHTLGLGRCWLGLARPKQREKDGLAHCITLAFGYPDEDLVRISNDFKRKPLDQISTGDDPRLEAARLAPSAVNSQNWFFDASDQSINVYMSNTGAIKKKLYGAMNVIDVGIALAHLQIASMHYQISFDCQILPQGSVPNKDNFTYMVTV